MGAGLTGGLADWLTSLLVEPAEGEDVFGSVCVLGLPLLARLEKVRLEKVRLEKVRAARPRPDV